MQFFIGIFLFVSKIQLPSIIQGTLNRLGSMIGPLSMLVIGMSLGNINLKSLFMEKRTYLISVLRLIVFPIVMIIILVILSRRAFLIVYTVINVR